MPLLGNPSVSVDISTVSVKPGECVTIYLQTAAGFVQVEAHVTDDGVPRVLLREEHMRHVGTFASVYDCTPAPEQGEEG